MMWIVAGLLWGVHMTAAQPAPEGAEGVGAPQGMPGVVPDGEPTGPADPAIPPAAPGQPSGTPPDGQPSGTPPDGQPPAEEIPGGDQRPVLVRVEDPGALLSGEPVVALVQGDQTITVAVGDAGTNGDAAAGDRVWGLVAEVDISRPVQAALYVGAVGGALIGQQEVTFDITQKTLDLTFRLEPGDQGGAKVAISTVSLATNGPPPLEQAATPAIDGQPGSPPAPGQKALPGGSGGSAGPGWLPYALGGAALLAALAAGRALLGAWGGRRGLIAPPALPLRLGTHPLSGTEVWVCAPEESGRLALAAAEALAAAGNVLYLPRPGAEPAIRAGHVWRLKAARPDPGRVRTALKAVSAAAAVAEGLDCLEEPLKDEGAAAVAEELIKEAGVPVVLVLRDGEAVPAGMAAMRWERQGAELVCGDRRLPG